MLKESTMTHIPIIDDLTKYSRNYISMKTFLHCYYSPFCLSTSIVFLVSGYETVIYKSTSIYIHNTKHPTSTQSVTPIPHLTALTPSSPGVDRDSGMTDGSLTLQTHTHTYTTPGRSTMAGLSSGHHGKHGTLIRYWFDVGPASQTLAQQ